MAVSDGEEDIEKHKQQHQTNVRDHLRMIQGQSRHRMATVVMMSLIISSSYSISDGISL